MKQTKLSPILTEKAISLGWNMYTDNAGKFPKEFPKELTALIQLNMRKHGEFLDTGDSDYIGHAQKRDWGSPWQWGGRWYTNMILYKGMFPEDAVDWIFVLDDGGHYKVGTKYSVYHTRDSKLFMEEKYTKWHFPGRYFLGCESGPMKWLCEQLDKYYFY
jgi:hypothetical protein